MLQINAKVFCIDDYESVSIRYKDATVVGYFDLEQMPGRYHKFFEDSKFWVHEDIVREHEKVRCHGQDIMIYVHHAIHVNGKYYEKAYLERIV